MTDHQPVRRIEELPREAEELAADEAQEAGGGLNFTKIQFSEIVVTKPTDTAGTNLF